MIAYYLKAQYIFAFKVQINLKQHQSFHHLLILRDKDQMIRVKKQTRLTLQNTSNESS